MGEIFKIISVPIFTGAIGYVTNWTGIWMLFEPVQFKGIHIPGLSKIVHGIMPRKIQQIPGIMNGGLGWQGIIPSRAAKMGSIAVDQGTAKVGTPRELLHHLDRRKLSEHILDSSRDDIGELVSRVMEREHPQFWRDLPPQMRAR